ncbi:ATP-binding cassette domain-containing protein [Nocardia terpenica]|uniref:ABC transporter ATP-binding protein n=1 Tax=Nocardia terpenica TaxID=455432 RepID=A0A164PU21_9NOCA|nr:ATP-binding cassette domain-containing protein [Nocardia terpenica]KZM76068.1 ABC transporter ATP-binding protein [Nocardia terpenica]MBF6062074.1 ATP-binding cassette domain-containing protein [Nocardia terpenica]MBF6106126.1 ATP-binding cassette domain-containing protein [Nocardia terpenica]MBF6110494.1 ATP-binding cassette domain-containing protein [Nocardia terpenica]MBF6120669.1 ATP-binding cassette domain-containing protein [Nocardia terpenica]
MTQADFPAVECMDLTHRYGDHTVVDHLNLRIERGEVFGLLGPNGAGKTTTIRLLTTLMPVRQGRVRVLGFEVGRRNTDIRYNLGYVPQQLSIEATLTGRQNVTWFARLFDVPRRERARRVEEVLDAMNLLDVADRLAAGYSGGMVRRLELAQALVNRPALLILDEPTVGLDPIARDGVWERVRELRERYGTTVLLTTHYMEEADTLCDRVALLHRGALRAVGAPADLKAELGSGATLEDVFRRHAGADLNDDTTQGGLRNVRNTRRTAQRAG